MLCVGCYYQIGVIEYTLCNIKHIKGPEGSKKRRELQNEKELEKNIGCNIVDGYADNISYS